MNHVNRLTTGGKGFIYRYKTMNLGHLRCNKRLFCPEPSTNSIPIVNIIDTLGIY